MHVESSSWAFDRVGIAPFWAVVPWRTGDSRDVWTRTIKSWWARSKATSISCAFLADHASLAWRWCASISIEYDNSCFHAGLAVRSDLAFMGQGVKNSKFINIIGLCPRETIGAFHALYVRRIEFLFVADVAWWTWYRFLHSSKWANITFGARFACGRHNLILIVSYRALESRLIHWPPWTIMSFWTFHHSIISACKTWGAFSRNSEEDTRVTLCFEICFIWHADINDGIPQISVIWHIAQH